MDGPEAPIELSPDDPSQLDIGASVRAEYNQRANRRIALTAAMFMGVLAFTGCNNQSVDAESPAASDPTTSEVTPSQEPDTESKFEAARDALAQFQPDIMPDLTEFSANPDHEQARKDAERYLQGKDSKLALINYSSMAPAELEQVASAVEDAFPAITAGTFTVDVEVIQASPIAKRLYKSHNPNGEFDPGDDKGYGSVIAAAVMPDLNHDYDSLIALTDSHFGTVAEDTNGSTLIGGKYADVTNVAGTEQLTIENRIIHENLHAVARLMHAKTVMSENGDFASAYPHEPGAEQRANLEEFLKTAWVDEYGMENIMGDTSRLFDTPPLTTAQLDMLGAANRMLDKPYVVQRKVLNEQQPTVLYNEQSSENAVAVYTLDELIGMHGRDDQGINGVESLDLTPSYYEGLWNIAVDGITPDKGQVNFMNMYISSDPSQGHVEQIIELPGGKSLTVSITEKNELQITVQ